MEQFYCQIFMSANFKFSRPGLDECSKLLPHFDGGRIGREYTLRLFNPSDGIFKPALKKNPEPGFIDCPCINTGFAHSLIF